MIRYWRRGPESNRSKRFCRPLPNLLATTPRNRPRNLLRSDKLHTIYHAIGILSIPGAPPASNFFAKNAGGTAKRRHCPNFRRVFSERAKSFGCLLAVPPKTANRAFSAVALRAAARKSPLPSLGRSIANPPAATFGSAAQAPVAAATAGTSAAASAAGTPTTDHADDDRRKNTDKYRADDEVPPVFRQPRRHFAPASGTSAPKRGCGRKIWMRNTPAVTAAKEKPTGSIRPCAAHPN